MKGLVLHTGANEVDFQQVEGVPVPQATDTYQPIPHATLWALVSSALTGAGFVMKAATFALWQGGQRFFALAEIVSEQADYNLVIGVRNSHDKTFPAGLVLGNVVFVCDNLAFSGEVKLSRKHTTFIMRDLPSLTARAVGKLTDVRGLQTRRIEAYKDAVITDTEAHDLIVRSLDARVLPVTRIPTVLEQWRRPSYPEFEPRTIWSLSNAYTEAAKGNLLELPRRTQALYGLLDARVGLATATATVAIEGQPGEVAADFEILQR